MDDGKRFKYCTQCGYKYLPTDKHCQMCGTPAKPKRTSFAEMLFRAFTDMLANMISDPRIQLSFLVLIIGIGIVLATYIYIAIQR